MKPRSAFQPLSKSYAAKTLSILACGWALLNGGPRAAAAPPPGLDARVRDQLEALQEEKATRTPVERKIDSQLHFSTKQRRGQNAGRGVTRLAPAMRLERDGRLLIDLKANVTPRLLSLIQQGGGTVINSFARHQAVRALVPLELVETLAALPEVRHVRPAGKAITNAGTVVSEGDITHRVNEARDVFGVAGEGVKVGVLSDSIDFIGLSQASSNLPPVTVLPGQAGVGIGEGTAMLEIVHDLVPKAELYFATAFLGEASFAQNIRDLYAAGCRIIVDDVTYFSESPFQDGLIAQAVNEVSAGGALFFSSAGNSGNKSDNTSGTWEGDFVDGGLATIGRGGRLHDFGGTTVNAFLPGGGFRAVDLFWSDPLGHSTNDYDVYVLDGAGTVVAASNNAQDGDDDPYETIASLGTGDRIVIVKYSGEPRFLHLGTGRGVLTIQTGGTVVGHNAAVASNAFSVAATWVRSPAVPFAGGPINPVESFSSDGPRRVFYHEDGTPITPGDFSSTGGRVFQKPDITAADGVSTSHILFGSFFGTSAAAPHAAAIAALLWSYNPSLTPAQIRTVMAETSLDIETPGVDNDSGPGIVMAMAALAGAPQPPPRLVLESVAILGGNGNGTLDPNECDDLHVRLHNRIGVSGDAATGVMVRLVSLSPNVSVDPTPQAVLDVPAAGFATNPVPLRISINPEFACGAAVKLHAIVTSANAGSNVFPLTLSASVAGIGTPLLSVASDVPLPIPDVSTAESTIPVSGVQLPLAKVTVSVHLTHTYDSDLVLTLLGPDGTAVVLSSRNGANESNYGLGCDARTDFDDDAPAHIATANAPFAGVFRPEQSLAAFNGKSGSAVNGTWKLQVNDVAEQDSGILQCWSLQLFPIACIDGGGACFDPPVITGQPQNLTVTNGQPAAFVVTATGSGPLSYQWYFNLTNALSDATNSTLILPAVSPADAGLYSVRLGNPYGMATSDAAGLAVIVPPLILAQPQSVTVTNGDDAVFAVVAVGDLPLSYQWRFNATNAIPGATEATLLLSGVTPAQSGQYSVVVGNPHGILASAPATLTVAVPPFIIQQPQSQTVNSGSDVSFAVVAGGTGPLIYQWYWNETNTLAGATNMTLTLTNATPGNAGGYSVLVSNDYGMVNSAEAVLTVAVVGQSPAITLTSPVNGAAFDTSSLPIAFTATASDLDSTIARVEFFSGSRMLASATVEPYEFEWFDPPLGSHQVFAVATDDGGLSSTSAVAIISVALGNPSDVRLVRTGAVWKYLDTGEDQGTAWRAVDFDDHSWAAGPAQLGYGEGDETTVVSFGPQSTNKFTTTYFRRGFALTDDPAFSSLRVRLLRDDGAVVYINDTEVFRSNMPTGAISFGTFASSTLSPADETNYFQANLDASILRTGANVVAVEVHQANRTSSDLGFDLELIAEREFPPTIVSQPQNQTAPAGETASFTVGAAGSLPLFYQWFFNETNSLPGATNAMLSLVNLDASQAGAYRVAVSNAFGAAFSSNAALTILPPGPEISLVRTGAVWKYLDLGADQGTAWRAVDFNDQDWAKGPAQLGYGDGDEATVVSFGPRPANKFPTTYFRHAFGLADATVFAGLRLGVLRDDGAVVYLNDVEIFRSNMPTGAISYGTLALAAIPAADETNYFRTTLDASTLRAGTNVVAVEVHQASRTSGDLSFDLELVARRRFAPTILVQPANQSVTAGDTAAFTVSADGSPPLRYKWLFNETNSLPDATNATLTLVNIDTNQAGLYRVVVSNPFGETNSLDALLTVSPGSANLPPVVVLTDPQDGAQFDFGQNIQLRANADDPDGQVVSVEFWAGESRLGQDSSADYRFDWTTASPGPHALFAVAIDNLGLASTSGIVRISVRTDARPPVTLVQTGAVWKYLDTGEDQGAAWRAPDFDDSLWASGPAELGYGDEPQGRPEATVINFGPDANNKFPTCYFRHTFVVNNPGRFTRLSLALLRDDGAVVYLNGQEALRSNMPGGEINFATLAAATASGAGETTYFTQDIDPASLVNGTNVIAVEVHQINAVSSDVSFDLSLMGESIDGPVILAQPQSQAVTNGDPATFSVTASGAGPLHYQWFFNEAIVLPDATNSILTLASVNTNLAGEYSVAVSNLAGVATSAVATLTVVMPPPNLPPSVAITAPADGTTFPESAVISVVVEASDADGSVQRVELFDGSSQLAILTNSPYGFNWIGASPGNHTLRALAIDDRGATNASSPVAITVLIPPPPPVLLVSLMPTGAVWKYLDTGVDQGTAWRAPSFDDSSWPGGPAELGYGDAAAGRPEATVIQFGSDPANKIPTYYFRRSFAVTNAAAFTELRLRLLRDDGAVVYLNGVEVFRSNLPEGEIAFNTLALASVVGAQESSYLETNISPSLLIEGDNVVAVEVHQANGDSSDVSFDFELVGTVPGAIFVLRQPQDQTVLAGETAQFSVIAQGTEPLSYQWFRNALFALPDETNATLTISNAQPGDEGSYSVMITNIDGEVRSASAVLHVLVPPAIVTQPQAQSVAVSAAVEFAVVATGTSPLAYQWLFNDTVPLPAATNALLQLASVQASDVGGYSVEVRNAAGAITSSVASLTITGSLVIVSQPRNVSVPSGAPAQFSVVAAGDPPLLYQWFFNTNTPLPNATNATFMLDNVSLADVGTYTVHVSNPSDTVFSVPAGLRVLSPPQIINLALNSPVSISFTTIAGQYYTVETIVDPGLPNWTPVPGASKLKGIGGVVTVTDITPRTTSRFYRVLVE